MRALARNQGPPVEESSARDALLEQLKAAVRHHEYIDEIVHHQGGHVECFVVPHV